MTQRQEAASRMAFAAYMHDLGKLAERAKIAVEKDDIDTHKQLIAPPITKRSMDTRPCCLYCFSD
jgi:hypothetical protein